MDEQGFRVVVSRDGVQYGPYTGAEAERYLAAGQLRHSDLARRDGTDSWLSLGTILRISAAPPPPPVLTSAVPPPLPAATANREIVPPNEELLRLFVGTNYEYYARKWKQAETKRSKRSWNWAAFFLGLGWMAYRRMYKYSWIFIGIIFAEEVFELAFAFPAAVSNAVNIAIAFTYGWHGNSWYKLYCEKKIREIAPNGMAIESARIEVVRQGGTNIRAAIGFVLVGFILLILLVALGG
jgi:hypothetical protein